SFSTGQVREQQTNLLPTQNRRETRRTLGALDVVHPGKVLLKDLPEQEQERRQSLVLRRRRDLIPRSKASEEPLNLPCPQSRDGHMGPRQKEAADPAQVGVLGAVGQSQTTNAFPGAHEQHRL